MRAGRAGLVALALTGCAQPPAVETNQILVRGEEGTFRELTTSERRSALAAMRLMADGYTPGDAPAPAPGGLRWSDIETAVAAALDDVEAAHVERTTEADGGRIRYGLRTIEGWPGELVVWRVEGPQVYDAEASIGRFPGEPNRRKRAEKLIEAIADHMATLGEMAWFNEP